MADHDVAMRLNDIYYELDESITDNGTELDIHITLPFSSLRTTCDINDCNECPVGYMKHNCGRNVPLDTGHKSANCKLKRVYMSDLLREIANYLDVKAMTK